MVDQSKCQTCSSFFLHVTAPYVIVSFLFPLPFQAISLSAPLITLLLPHLALPTFQSNLNYLYLFVSFLYTKQHGTLDLLTDNVLFDNDNFESVALLVVGFTSISVDVPVVDFKLLSAGVLEESTEYS